MPRRTDLHRILIIGSGPIIIGQACEFDYSGTQACKALRADGFDVVLVNSNPATIMTDPDLANRTYVEPLSRAYLEEIIRKERPDTLLSTVGGQIGLNLAARHPELVRTLVAHEPPLMELLPDADHWRSTFRDIDETYRTAGVFPAMGAFGSAVEEGGPKYSEQMDQAPSTPEAQEMMGRMTGNFELFIAHEIQPTGAYQPDIDTLKKVPTRIVSAAGEDSAEQAARRATIALAERLGIDVTYLPGAHGGWGTDPQTFADTLDKVLQAD